MQTNTALKFEDFQMTGFPHRHILSVEALSRDDITLILDLAEAFLGIEQSNMPFPPLLQGLNIFNLFFENSTRTRISFELAAKKLGAQVVHFHEHASSISKGESLADTFQTLDAMGPDAIIVRHGGEGAVQEIAGYVGCPVLNAGDGTNEHPTQALLDALTIRRAKGTIEGLTVAICGDIKHSRVARSNTYLLNRMGAKVRLVGPATLLPKEDKWPWAEFYTNLEDGIEGADIVMMLRIQKERMPEGRFTSTEDYFRNYGLTKDKLAVARPDALVMHPGPINRGVEIAADVADDPARSLILQQVANGVAVRMACLDLLTRTARRRRK